MSGPVPEDDDILVIRVKTHKTRPNDVEYALWSRTALSMDEFLGFLHQMIARIKDDDFERIG